MSFGASLSLDPDTGRAIDEALEETLAQLSGDPNVLLAFASGHHAGSLEEIARRAHKLVPVSGTSLGCVADGVIGGAAEVEDVPALAVWGARLPEGSWDSGHLQVTRMREGVAVSGWRVADQPVGAILLADPRSFPAGPFVTGLAASYPGMPIVGGLASPSGGGLFLNGKLHDAGAVVLSFGPRVTFDSLVSQGCRPVGEPAVVTAADGFEILSIGGKPALEFLQDLVDELPEEEQQRLADGLQLGVVVDEYQTEFGPGDFLIRPVVGADPDGGAISIGEPVSVGRTVQFQVRDPVAADEDLRKLLAHQEPAEGVLLFSCNGRGRRFFGSPHHDVSVVREVLRPSALAGFFAAGELGPVGGTNFLHGYTATLARLEVDQAFP